MEKTSQYYVDFDATDNIVGFYFSEIHGDAIPETAVPITEEQWQTYSADARLYKRDGETIRAKTQQELDDEIAALPPAPKTPDQLRIEQLETQLAQQNSDNITFTEFILSTLGVE